jgi:3-oxoacyl-[acyl-carrier protein] reductase
MTISLEGKRAFVGGSSQGIGFAIAEQLAACGATVTLTGRHADKLVAAVAKLPTPKGQQHNFMAVNFGDLKTLEVQLFDYQRRTAAMPVSILVINSGGPTPTTAFDATLPQYQAYFEEAILASQMLVQAFVPAMKAAHFGRILTVLSSTVKQPKVDLGISNTIRAAVANWAKSLSIELGEHGITVNNLLPGLIQTERLNELIGLRAKAADMSEEKIMANMAASIPAKRIGMPSDLGTAAAFLASDFAAYINGVNVPIDGGFLGTL